MRIEELGKCLRLGVKTIGVKVVNFDVQKSHIVMTIRQYLCFFFSFLVPSVFFAQEKASQNEWTKINYVLQTDIVVSTGKYAPFWLVSNRHGLSSLENNNANLSVGIFRDFDKKKGFAWAYGAEFAGAWHYTSPFVVQQLYADVKYNCWELSIGGKERCSEDRHRTLSGGGLTFSPNARPIPQVRLGINEYTTVPWCFNGWIQVKGHFSYGWHTDDHFQESYTAGAVSGTRYSTNILFHEKTAFLKIGNKEKTPFSFEMGLEMYSQFGGCLWRQHPEGDVLIYDFPNTYKEYIKAFIPMAGGEDAPQADKVNVNGNILGSWHFALGYEADNWNVKAYYEHYYEDHSGLLGFDYHNTQEGRRKLIAYLPWRDGLYGVELTVPKNRVVNDIVYEYITSRDQSGPVLHNSGESLPEQAGGIDHYYNHEYFQSWQHWGMAICNPHTLSPLFNDKRNLTMPYQRIRSHHLGFDGIPFPCSQYRVMASWTKHWGSIMAPLPNPLTQFSMMGEVSFLPARWGGWRFIGALAFDRSELIGNNFGGMLTVRHTGKLMKSKR